MSVKDKIFNKLTSARFIMVVLFTLTTCYGFIKGIVPCEAFLPLAFMIGEWYFKREDRKKEDNKDV